MKKAIFAYNPLSGQRIVPAKLDYIIKDLCRKTFFTAIQDLRRTAGEACKGLKGEQLQLWLFREDSTIAQ